MGKIISPTVYERLVNETVPELQATYGLPVESYKAYKYLKHLSDKNNIILEIAKELNLLQDGGEEFFDIVGMSEAAFKYMVESNASVKRNSIFNKLELETVTLLASVRSNYNNPTVKAKVIELYIANILFKNQEQAQTILNIILDTINSITTLYGNTYFMCTNDSVTNTLRDLVTINVNKSIQAPEEIKLGITKNILVRVRYILQEQIERMNLCFIDTETTGLHNILDKNSAKPTQVSYIITDLEGNIKKVKNCFIKQENIPKEVVEINGIDEDFLKRNDAISEKAFVENVLCKDLLEDNLIFVGHNVPFDLEVLDKSLKRFKGEDSKLNLNYFENTDYIDTFIVAEKVKNGNKFVKSSLEGLTNYLNISEKDISNLTNKLYPGININIRHLSHYDVVNQFIFTLKIAPILNLDKLKYEYELEKEAQVKNALSW